MESPPLPGGRIAFVYDSLYPHVVGGAGRYYWALSRALARRVAVSYVTSRFLARRRELVDGVEVVGVSVRPRPGSLLPKLLFGLGVLWHLLVHGGRYAVVHCACFPHAAVLAARLGLLPHRGTRLVVDWHEVIPRATWRRRRGRLGDLGYLLQAVAMPRGDAAVTYSGLHRGRLEAHRRRDDVVVMPEFLPESEPPPFHPGASRENLVVFLGRLVSEKRAGLVPAVVRELRRADPSWRGLIFGGGPDEDRVTEAIRSSGQQDAVQLRGFAPWEEVSAALGRARCLVFPSQREGFGLAVLEAAGHGLPAVLVAGDDNAAVELIEPGENGLVVPEPDPAGIAAAVLELSRDPQIHQRTRAWFERAARRHSLDRAVEELLALDARLSPRLRPAGAATLTP
jgi:glycosyltransferase involved in cell wall biosynthesis